MAITSSQAQTVLNNARCIVDIHQINQLLDRLAVELSAVLKQSNPLIIPVMNGGLILAGHLLTRLQFPLQVDYCHATRYRNETEGGQLHWIAKPQNILKGRTVLILDDILDEGITLSSILEFCRKQKVEQVYSCVLVEKIHDRKSECPQADFVGMSVDDVYVFGFGMDYKGYLRNAPGIFAVDE